MTSLRSKRGHSLIEAAVAILIVSIAVLGLYSVVASSARTQGDVDDQAALDASLRKAQALLALYVSADVSEATRKDYAPNGSWQLPGDPCPTALSTGCSHVATSLLDQGLRAKHPGMRLTFTVKTPTPDAAPQVEFTVEW